MKELREKVKDAIYLTSGENQSDYVNKLTETLISLILDEVKEAVDNDMIATVEDALEAIDNLRG